MALRKTLNIEGEGFVNTAGGAVSIGQQRATFVAYCKIVALNCNKSQGTLSLECSAEGYKISKTYQVEFSTEEGSGNFIKQAYEHLKTLPEWADATDC